METEGFECVRLVGDERRVASTLREVSLHWQHGRERFLFVSPHDDDVVLGGGLMMQLSLRENVPVYILIVTDGSMGYCSPEERDAIADIRREETYECYHSLGVPRENIMWLRFPDCNLNSYRGRRVATPEDKAVNKGYTGLQNAFTYYLRRIRPTQCFLPTSNDLHPDHRITHEEFIISLFHAGGDIWPELGEPLDGTPHVHELGVYCDFPTPPQLRVRTPESCLQKKLDAIAEFKSQKQISALIDIVRESGPEEYSRPLNFRLYEPTSYRELFKEGLKIPYVTR